MNPRPATKSGSASFGIAFVQAHPLLFGIGVMIAVLGTGLVFVSIIVIGLSGSRSSVMTRERFKYLVIGETEQGVMRAVGRPDSTIELGGQKIWRYYDERAIRLAAISI
jgi:hypothetical protein